MTAAHLNARLAVIAADCRLPSRTMSYLCRGFFFPAHFYALVGRESAKMLLCHQQNRAVFDRVYSGGPARVDVALLRLGEVEPSGGYADASKLRLLEEGYRKGFAMVKLGLGHTGEDREEEAAPRRNRRLQDTVAHLRAKYDYFEVAAAKLEAALKKVNRTCLVESVISNKLKDNLDEPAAKLTIAKSPQSRAAKVIAAAITAHAALKTVISRATTQETRITRKERRGTASTKRFVDVADAAAAVDAIEERAEARRRVIERTNRRDQGKGALFVVAEPALHAAGEQSDESLGDLRRPSLGGDAEDEAESDVEDAMDEDVEHGLEQALAEAEDVEEGGTEDEDDDDEELRAARVLTNEGASTAQDRAETAIGRVAVTSSACCRASAIRASRWRLRPQSAIASFAPCWAASAPIAFETKLPGKDASEQAILDCAQLRCSRVREHLLAHHPQVYLALTLGEKIPRSLIHSFPQRPPSPAHRKVKDDFLGTSADDIAARIWALTKQYTLTQLSAKSGALQAKLRAQGNASRAPDFIHLLCFEHTLKDGVLQLRLRDAKG